METRYKMSYLAVLAPILLSFITVLLLLYKQKYLKFFIIGIILNTILNCLLKIVIKEPRPSEDIKIIEIGVVNGHRISFDKFGMPSGHAQMCGFMLAFITMVYKSPIISGFYLIVTILTLFQRYLFKNHSIFQLLIGLTIGILFGYNTYIFAHDYIRGEIKEKEDDNAHN
jgi:membrane-associated phospholipid phosphatase